MDVSTWKERAKAKVKEAEKNYRELEDIMTTMEEAGEDTSELRARAETLRLKITRWKQALDMEMKPEEGL